MTIQQFIGREFGNNDGKVKQCSSVIKDGEGNIYSYGAHYPLVFKVFGLNFINTAGYSVSTAKHINWASQAVEHYGNPLIDIKLPGNFRLADHNWKYGDTPKALEYFKTVLVDQAVELQMKMLKKKRKNTMVYESMRQELNRLQSDIRRVTV